jgi:hypothetical protein
MSFFEVCCLETLSIAKIIITGDRKMDESRALMA